MNVHEEQAGVDVAYVPMHIKYIQFEPHQPHFLKTDDAIEPQVRHWCWACRVDNPQAATGVGSEMDDWLADGADTKQQIGISTRLPNVAGLITATQT